MSNNNKEVLMSSQQVQLILFNIIYMNAKAIMYHYS